MKIDEGLGRSEVRFGTVDERLSSAGRDGAVCADISISCCNVENARLYAGKLRCHA